MCGRVQFILLLLLLLLSMCVKCKCVVVAAFTVEYNKVYCIVLYHEILILVDPCPTHIVKKTVQAPRSVNLQFTQSCNLGHFLYGGYYYIYWEYIPWPCPWLFVTVPAVLFFWMDEKKKIYVQCHFLNVISHHKCFALKRTSSLRFIRKAPAWLDTS